MPEVTFRPKSSWQKPDCLFCSREATLEAVSGDALIRCCDSEECGRRAASLAKETGEIFKK